jgi:hypothetical protein
MPPDDVYGDMTPAEIATYNAEQDSLYDANEAFRNFQAGDNLDSIHYALAMLYSSFEMNSADFGHVETLEAEIEKLQAELDAARADVVKLTARNRVLIGLLDWFADYASESAKRMDSLLIPLELTDMLKRANKALNASD